MLLEALADNVFGDVFVNEVVAVFDRVQELVLGDQLKLFRRNQNHDKRDRQRDKQPDDVLGDIPAANAENGLRVEVRR